MVVGVRKYFKQPVAYYLSSGFVTADRLSALIKEVCMSPTTGKNTPQNVKDVQETK